MDTIERVPVADELFEWSADGADLIGSRCTGCGTHYFPKSLSCRNPTCDTKTVERATFGRHGVLRSFTVQHYRPPALFRADDWAPYAIGLIDLPEGLRVMAMLSGVALDELRIDTPLTLDVRRLYIDEAGREVVTYSYAPSASTGAER